ncbi:MAG: tRNA-guanine transglycosylase [Candidatus Asgardarchaeia archaeon]
MSAKFKKPFLWFTQTIHGRPKPWEYFEIDGLMFNAYEILNKPYVKREVIGVGIHNYVKFKKLVMMDSGGFLFMKKDEMNVNPIKIIDLYEKSKPNFGVVLDYPINPTLSENVVIKRLNKTLENTRKMVDMKSGPNPELIPVIHGYDTKTISWFIKELEKIYDFRIYGVGSLVPNVFNSKRSGGIYNVVKIVSFIRSILPDKILHVFGVGSSLTMHIMFYSGADSVDSASWRVKAAYGAIQLPGVGDRYITSKKKSKKYTPLSKKDIKLLEECKCPACKERGLEGLKESFELRAIHNAWVYQKEVEKARRLLDQGEYEDYVTDALRKSKFSKVIDIVKNEKIDKLHKYIS